MQKKGKLELTWVGKYDEKEIEPRILVEDKSKSYGDPDSENMLIHGDNLIALKALEQDYAGKIKCIYIDPPYNTGSAFKQYDDSVEHSIWLSLISQRLQILYKLLADDGSIWINLDDNEAHYCKVLCDEIFGRSNFLADVIWEKADSPKMDAKLFSSRHDHILVYAKNILDFKLNKIEDEEIPEHYNKRDENGKAYYLKPLRAMGVDGYREKRPALYFPVEAPDGEMVYPKNQDGSDSRWRWSREKVEKDKSRLEWVRGKKGWSLYFRIYHENSEGTPPETLWKCEEVGSNRTSKKENKDLFGADIFDTPKPEALIKRVLQVSTVEGDIVLDSFLGSATTSAVAHKMGRKWIGIELGDHAYTHCKVRMDKVIDGEQGGISKSVNWQGGGGYKFYELAPSLLVPNPKLPTIKQINPEYTFEMMCEAICKLEGFKYKPDGKFHGKSSEQRFIHITKEFVNGEYINSLLANLGEGQSLLVYGMKIQSGLRLPDNIIVKKIPKDLLDKCAFESEVR